MVKKKKKKLNIKKFIYVININQSNIFFYYKILKI